MERRAERHGVNGHQAFVLKLEHDHLEHVPGTIGPDRQQLRRVTVGIEVDQHECMIHGVSDVAVADVVTSSRTMDLHTPLA